MTSLLVRTHLQKKKKGLDKVITYSKINITINNLKYHHFAKKALDTTNKKQK